ncbi:MAG TPA: lysine--tRNA ligase [Actinomycetota bacterium]|jgi:lysyl-tRNA synthetase class 2|nr:lysine--tRNA ligase [Actinomycetota bacterium]
MGEPHGGPPGEPSLGREREVLKARRESRERLGDKAFALNLEQALGVREPTHSKAIRDEFAGAIPDGEVTDQIRTVAGRVVMLRDMGKLKFIVVRDRAGDIQLLCREGDVAEGTAAVLDEIDLGDIVAATGRVGKTKKGELSVFVERLAMLSKALRPLPEKWHGLKDPDLQQRLRYLQLATDLDARRIVTTRANVLSAFRAYLDVNGFIEVETPVLQSLAGGALAKPFVTHHEALDIDLYLRIALELYLKRLLVGGLERVYEIGRNFRNEGIDRTHNPEFTMMECYQAYTDYEGMMRITEELMREAAIAVHGRTTFTYRGRELDVGRPWRRITMLGSLSEHIGEEIDLDRGDLGSLADARGVYVDPAWGPGKIVQELWEDAVEPTLFEPTFVMDFPREVSPLARPNRHDPQLTEHVDPYLGGIEIGAGYSELTDPDDQRSRFEAQMRARSRGEEETHPLDEDFLQALEHGMPPAGGLGIGVDRVATILADMPSIRDVILFPHHRPMGRGEEGEER